MSNKNSAPPEKSGDWLGQEPVIPEDAISETLNADVAVIGAGLAGVSAARAAAEKGAAVVLIEKSAQANCRSGEFAVPGGRLNEYFGCPPVDTDLIVDRLMKEGTYRVKRAILSRWARSAHEAFDWYISATPEIYIAKTTREDIPDEHKSAYIIPAAWPLPEHYDYTEEEFPTFPNSVEIKPTQAAVFRANVRKCAEELGVRVFYGHFAEKLETNGGRVTGVIVRDAGSGRYMRIKTSGGVVLATGDNANNPEILAHFTPEVIENSIPVAPMGNDVEGNPINRGDGLKLGAWIGARVQQHHAPMIHHMGGKIGGTGNSMGNTPFLLLNRHGRRFTNESVSGQQLQNQLELQPDCTAYQIFDDGWREQLSYMPANHGCCCYYDALKPKNNERNFLYRTEEIFENSLKHGFIISGDTLKELFSKLDIDEKAALASVERYNSLADAGYDEDYNKPAKRMFALRRGPFYACLFTAATMLVCIGGLESDEECHVYGAKREVIPGLYAAGNVQGNRYAVEYPICMRGTSHSLALFYGRIAGENAAAGK